MDDLRQDAFVMLQKRLDPWWNVFWCFFAPALIAQYGWGEKFMNGVMVPGVLRYVYVLHCTWLVNSAAHLWGERPYDPKSNPAENPLVASPRLARAGTIGTTSTPSTTRRPSTVCSS